VATGKKSARLRQRFLVAGEAHGERKEDDGERDDQQPRGDRAGDEDGRIALVDGPGAAQLLLGEGAENYPDANRRDREVVQRMT
jgi:hypothetical protein